MVGNYIPEEKRLGYKEETVVFLWMPKRTNLGWRWLTKVKRVREVVVDREGFISKVTYFIGVGHLTKDQITYEAM